DTPSSTFNIGAYWTHVVDGFVLKPRAWYQFVGSQNVFDNNAGMPTNQKLGSHGVLNLALAATMPSSWYADAAKRVTLKVEVMNVLDDKYNQFEYISAGGLYGTATGGYPIVYPGAPQAVYATIAVAF
ncbi:MAG: TonB-dependent receptor, partial [Alphaproteobacteria bacterium]|nr:TonB-dependent receptor [Alphaproteobacteria bacterium]